MDIQMKHYADSKNLKELTYIFVDALDVDPTFVRYEEEYNYCKSVPGLLEPYIELTPFRQDKNLWDEDYWTSLKMDLVENFSDRRMTHMREVATVFLAEKVSRILEERSAALTTPVVTAPEHHTEPIAETGSIPVQLSKAEQERQAMEEDKRKLEEENRKADAAQKADAQRIEQQRRMNQTSAQYRTTGDSSKKAIGIAVAAVAVTVAVLFLILVLK